MIACTEHVIGWFADGKSEVTVVWLEVGESKISNHSFRMSKYILLGKGLFHRPNNALACDM
jgi:hypothetical protein